MEECISVFDMLKIGVGPSSSHTLGPWRAAERFLSELRSENLLASTEKVQVDLYGSLSLTGKGHATDLALLLGLSGQDPETIPVDEITTITTQIQRQKSIRLGNEKSIPFFPESEIIFNKNGLRLALMIITSSLLAGIVAAFLLGLPAKSGLMLSSGFGWYTLSSILNTSFIDHNFGACSFFIDFIREIIAIILIPSLGQRYPATFVAYSGATAMDFSLPIIKQNLHEDCILLAISSGMLLSVAVPILITLFAKL